MREIQAEEAREREAMIASGALFGHKLTWLDTGSKHTVTTKARKTFGDMKNHAEIPKTKNQKVNVLKQLGKIKYRLMAVEKETEEQLLQHVSNAQEVCQDAIEMLESALVKAAIETADENVGG